MICSCANVGGEICLLAPGACMGDGVGVIAGRMVARRGGLRGVLVE